MQYRPEVDGLRAVAVLPVILFHAGFSAFSGGFVGVDVFFVISGYLITTILIEDIENKRFSIVNFYERRARRILPVLFFVILACIPFAWAWMMPSQLQDFSKSLIGVSLFASNIFFWRESGYFAAAAEEKPLLHTWSLAVEEQYYLLFPIFLLFAWRFGKDRVFWTIVVFSGLSLALSEWGWRNAPSASFYLLPTRAWELLAGSIAAFIVKKHGVKSNNLVALTGFFAILVSIFVYDKNTPFPSLYALAPVVGVVLIILFSDKKTFVAKLLSTKVFVGIGLVSYSAYLWHQPLFAFARIKSLGEPSMFLMGALSVLSLILAVLSWKYVEQPFRNRQLIRRKLIFSLSGLGFLAVAILGLFFPSVSNYRFSDYQLSIISDGEQNREVMKNEAYDRYGCFFDHSQSASLLIENQCVKESEEGRIVLFGDSEAAHYFDGFAIHDIEVMQFTGTSCRAIGYEGNSERCSDFLSIFFSSVVPVFTEQDLIIVSSNWWNTHRRIGDESFKKALNDTLSRLKSSGAEILLLTNTPDFVRDPYAQFAMQDNLSQGMVYLPVRDIWKSDEIIIEVAAEMDVEVFNVASLFCKNAEVCLFKDEVDYLFFDSGHLSYHGSEFVASVLASEFGWFERN